MTNHPLLSDAESMRRLAHAISNAMHNRTYPKYRFLSTVNDGKIVCFIRKQNNYVIIEIPVSVSQCLRWSNSRGITLLARDSLGTFEKLMNVLLAFLDKQLP